MLLAGALVLAAALLAPSGRAALRDDEIDRSALRHDPNGPDQVLWTTAENPKLRFLFLRFRMKKDDVKEAGARLYLINAQGQEGFRDHQLEPWATVDSFEYRALTIPFEDDPTAPPNRTHWRGYRLYADDEGDIDWYGADSVATHEEKVARFTTLFRRGAELKGELPGLSDRMLVIPAWAQDAVVYRTRIDWRADTTDAALSAQLVDLRHQLKSLDSLAINTLLVGAEPTAGFPLERCWPPTPTGDAAADSVARAGTPCGKLMALCESAHRRQMKVMLELNLPQPVGGVSGNISAADADSLLGLVRQGIGCGVDGYYLHGAVSPAGQADEDPAWTALRETAKALLPEAYLVLAAGGQPELARWINGTRVDAVADDWYGTTARDFLAEGSPVSAEELRTRIDRRRLATPGPFERIAWHGPAAAVSAAAPAGALPDQLVAIVHLTVGGVPELPFAGPALSSAPATAMGRDARLLAPLLALRRDHPALRRGSFNIAYAQGGQFAFYRRSSEEILLVAVNRDTAPATVKITLPRGVGFVSVRNVVDLLTGTQYPVRGGEITLKDLPPQGGVIVQLR